MNVAYEPVLVERAVLAAVRAGGSARAFHADRERPYGLRDEEEREAAFAALHARWFERLGLDRPLGVALAERPELGAGSRQCLVARAFAARAEGADLLVAPPARPTVLLRIAPETLAERPAALAFFRHELLHIADMLRPDFGYEPRLGPAGARPGASGVGADRYHAAWAAFVAGRLAREGRAAPAGRAESLRGFSRACAGLGPAAMEDAFRRFFDAAQCTHAELVAFAAGHVRAAAAEPGRRAQEPHGDRERRQHQADERPVEGPAAVRGVQAGRARPRGVGDQRQDEDREPPAGHIR